MHFVSPFRLCLYSCLSLLLLLAWMPSCAPQEPVQEATPSELNGQEEHTQEANPPDSGPSEAAPTELPTPETQEPTAEPVLDAATPEVPTEPTPDSTQPPENTTPETTENCSPVPQLNLQQTWDWAKTKGDPLATGMLTLQNGKTTFEAYAPENETRLIPSGGGVDKEYNMYSQTKSLTGLAALILVKQKKIQLDDKVSQYISEWTTDTNKKEITIRELLSLSSGIKTYVNPPNDQNAQRAIQSPYEGKKFAYGSEPFLVFSVLVERVTSMSTEAFLQKHLFSVIGMQLTIKKTVDGYSSMAQGGQTTLRNIAKLGEELNLAAHGKGLVFDANDIQTLMKPGLNAAYGLSVWLNQQGARPGGEPITAPWPDCGPTGLFSFLGAGGQVLTILPIKRFVLAKSARLGSVEGQASQELWNRIFQGDKCVCHVP